MPNLRLTRRIIDDIPFAACGQMLYRDTLLSGFGFRVGSRSKVYFAEGQVNRETRHVTIGRADLSMESSSCFSATRPDTCRPASFNASRAQ